MGEFPAEPRPLHEWAKFDPIADTVTIYDIVYSRELLRSFSTSPIGFTFKIVDRHPGGLTITQERSALEAAAPDLLAALTQCVQRFASSLDELKHLLADHPIDALQDEAANEADEEALARARAAIAKASVNAAVDETRALAGADHG